MNFSNKYAAIIFILAKVIVYKAYDELYLVQCNTQFGPAQSCEFQKVKVCETKIFAFIYFQHYLCLFFESKLIVNQKTKKKYKKFMKY